MALFHVQYYSQALAGLNDFYVILPNDVPPFIAGENANYQRPTKTLILLHGYSGINTDWLYGSSVNEASAAYNLAIVLPTGKNSFYLDQEATGEKWAEFVGKELPEYVCRTFGLSSKREDMFIGGYSMGGYGALHTGLAYPETFSRIMALSSALIVQGLNENMGKDNLMANLAYYKRVFGDFDTAKLSHMNYEVQIKELKAAGKEIPGIFMGCGTEDFLFEANNALDSFLKAENVPHEYFTIPGIHNFTFWNAALVPGIEYCLK